MKLTLQVTDRDRRMLVLLAIFLFLLAFWQFMLKDTLESFLALNEQVTAYEGLLSDADNYATSLIYYQRLLEEAQTETDKLLSGYFPALPADYYVDVVLNTAGTDLTIVAINSAGVEHLTFQFVPAAIKQPQGSLGDAARAYQALHGDGVSANAGQELATVPLASTEILFAFSNAQYAGLAAFLERLEQLPAKIVVRGLTATARGGALSGSFIMVFPGVPSMSGDLSAFATPANPGAGRADAFNYAMP